MTEIPPSGTPSPHALFPARKIMHMLMLSFAFLLPFLTWVQAAGCALLALAFNVLTLPHPDVDHRAGGPSVSRRMNRWPIVLYPVSVLVLILVYRHHLHVVAAAWAIMALGDGMASVVGQGFGGPRLPWNREKTWSGSFGFVCAGTVGAYVLTRWVAPALPADRVLRACVATALVGALVETLPIRLDDNASVPLVAGGCMFWALLMERSALASNLPYLGRRVALAATVNLVFALLALALKMVDRSGAACGFMLGAAVYLGYGYKSFAVMLVFFVIGSLATHVGYAKKAARGIAEKGGGARSWREALANSLTGAFFAVLVITTNHETAFLVALVATFAEAAGDTVSSEVGQWLSDRAYLITTFEPVRAGESGGVTAGGTAAGLVASALVVAVGCGLGLCGEGGTPHRLMQGGAGIALAAAFSGNLFDSLLGATLERRGLVTNGIVNFAGTSLAGGLALGLSLHFGI